jgi:hypothetical protein
VVECRKVGSVRRQMNDNNSGRATGDNIGEDTLQAVSA